MFNKTKDVIKYYKYNRSSFKHKCRQLYSKHVLRKSNISIYVCIYITNIKYTLSYYYKLYVYNL